ncbi:neuromedin-U isoform X2 [Arvicanthis niloticus]|uniref:neuromedin-U isoform X2 n=1 Tax=Arvicanthis niloticus TaxID=61156 RepID=UPI00402BD0B6
MVTLVCELSKRHTGEAEGQLEHPHNTGYLVPNPEPLGGNEMSRAAGRHPGLSAGQLAAATVPPLLSLLLLLACCVDACRGVPMSPQRLQPEKELQLWNEIQEACASFLSLDSRPQASVALRKLCREVMEIFQKPQEQSEKDNTKRFLFHYSKTQKLGNSNVVEEYNGPLAAQSRGYFLFRPRNGKRSASFI